MHLTVRSRRDVGAAAVAVLLSLPLADAGAQSCAAPTPLVANGMQFVNTCFGDASLVAACWSTFALAGRAGVLTLSLPYPAGTITVTPQNVGYDPAVFLLPMRCNSTAGCATAVDSSGPGVSESVSLSRVDSGNYYLVIAPLQPALVDCGQVMVSYGVTPQQQGLIAEGLFRGTINGLPPH